MKNTGITIINKLHKEYLKKEPTNIALAAAFMLIELEELIENKPFLKEYIMNTYMTAKEILSTKQKISPFDEIKNKKP